MNVSVNLPASSVSLPSFASDLATVVAAATGTVSVNQCGLPVDDAFVTVVIDRALPAFPDSVSGTSVGNGQYAVQIPVPDPNAPQNFKNKCDAVALAINKGCIFGAQMLPVCVAIQQAVLLLPPPLIPAGEAIAAGCFASAVTVELFCAVFGSSPAEGVDSVIDKICSGATTLFDRVSTGPVTLSSFASRGGISGIGTTANASAQGPFPTLAVTLPGERQVANFLTNPADPGPQQGYTATAVATCTSPGDMMRLEVVGTDGYTDDISCPAGQAGSVACSLNVPGGDAGVRDTITVTIGNVSRTIILVF